MMGHRRTRTFAGIGKHVTASVTSPFPYLIHADGPGAMLDEYLAHHQKDIEAQLARFGAVLCRGFQVTDAADFSRAITRLAPDILNYTERSSPRSEVISNVYTSTDHPRDQDIAMHNEQSYTLNWPQLICFFCLQKADVGGDTPIADNRKILARLPEALRKKFHTHGVMYQRVYSTGLGVDWQTAFQTDVPAEVDAFCEARGIETTWESGGRLRTRQRRAAFQYHLATDTLVWFNHALFFHVSSLAPELTRALIEAVGIENVPTNTFFGNGEAFSEDDLLAMREAVSTEKTRFGWKNGDVLILDNMLSQHGRDPFSGKRQILTLMARPYADYASPGHPGSRETLT